MERDLDSDLMQKFSCLGTTDKDTLISELYTLLESQISSEECAFLLDMTNWNLQAAVGAYYDLYLPNSSNLSMSVVSDVTVGEGETIPPDSPFIKTWRIQNTGPHPWPPGVSLRYVGGHRFDHANLVVVRAMDPEDICEVTVQMRSPRAPGIYQSQWRTCTTGGRYFGDVIWVIVKVEVGDLQGATQQPPSAMEEEFSTELHCSLKDTFTPSFTPTFSPSFNPTFTPNVSPSSTPQQNVSQIGDGPEAQTPTQHVPPSNPSVTIATNDQMDIDTAMHDETSEQP